VGLEKEAMMSDSPLSSTTVSSIIHEGDPDHIKNPNISLAQHKVPSHFTIGANIPVPKFDPMTDLTIQFLEDVEVYMLQKRLSPSEWLSQLSFILSKDPLQDLWWRRTRILAVTWDDFKRHFSEMFGSPTEDSQALENLVVRRQTTSEPFEKFALSMELQYLRVHPNATRDTDEVLTFISQRAIPSLKAHLLGSKARSIYDLIKLAKQIEQIPIVTSVDSSKTADNVKTHNFSGSKSPHIRDYNSHKNSNNTQNHPGSRTYSRKHESGTYTKSETEQGKGHHTKSHTLSFTELSNSTGTFCDYCGLANHTVSHCFIKTRAFEAKNKTHKGKSANFIQISPSDSIEESEISKNEKSGQ